MATTQEILKESQKIIAYVMDRLRSIDCSTQTTITLLEEALKEMTKNSNSCELNFIHEDADERYS